MTVLVLRPGPPLGLLVPAIVYRAGEQRCTSVETILPGPHVGVWVNLNGEVGSAGVDGRISRAPGARLAGPASHACVLEFEQGHGHVWVRFAVGAAGRFMPGPVAEATDELVPLEMLWGRTGGCLRERLLEAASSPRRALQVMADVLAAQLTDASPVDPALAAAARALSRGAGAGQVAEEVGLLPRTLHRRFTAQIGLSPKRFARVQRLQRVVRDLDGKDDADWAEVAARHGYADQPHLCDEFRELAGVTPGQYLRSRIDGPNHLRPQPQRAERSLERVAAGTGQVRELTP